MVIENARDADLRGPAQLHSTSSALTNPYSDNEDDQSESNGGYGINECSWTACDDLLYRSNIRPTGLTSVQHESIVSGPNTVWPQQQEVQQGPTSLMLRPDDYTLKQLPQYRSTTTSSKDNHGKEHQPTPPIPPPRQTRLAVTTATTPPPEGRTIHASFDGVDRQLGRVVIVTNNYCDSDNNISRTSANNNKTGSSSGETDVNSLSCFSTALLPPSPAPNDDDGCYDDEIVESRQLSQAIYT